MTESIELPGELEDVRKLVGIVFPKEDENEISTRTHQVYQEWSEDFPKLSTGWDGDLKKAIGTLAKENEGAAISSFLDFWNEKPNKHHIKAANAATLSAGAIATVLMYVIQYKRSMINELQVLKKILDDHRRSILIRWLPGVDEYDEQGKGQIEYTRDVILKPQRERVISLINKQGQTLDRARRMFDEINASLTKEGFKHTDSNSGNGNEQWKMPKLGGWMKDPKIETEWPYE